MLTLCQALCWGFRVELELAVALGSSLFRKKNRKRVSYAMWWALKQSWQAKVMST